jgi:hypothetical protein
VWCPSTRPIWFYIGRSRIWQSVRDAQSYLFVSEFYSVPCEFHNAQHSSAIRATRCAHNIYCC